MSTAEVLLPWRTVTEIKLAVESLVHGESGLAVEGALLDLSPTFGDPSVDLCDVKSWQRLRVGIRVSVNQDQMCEALGDGEASNDAVRCVAVLLSSQAKHRRGVDLIQVSKSEWTGYIELDRRELAASGTVSIRLVRSRNLASREPGKAKYRGAILGEAGPVVFYFDSWARPYNGPLKWKWMRFEDAQDSWLRSRATDLIFVDASDVPTVYMNLGVPEFQVVLESKERIGAAALLRDATAAGLAALAWQQLIHICLIHQPFDEETGTYAITNDWRGAIARTAVSIMYPDQSVDAGVGTFRAAITESDQQALTLARVSAAAQHLSYMGRGFSKTAQLAEKVGNKP